MCVNRTFAFRGAARAQAPRDAPVNLRVRLLGTLVRPQPQLAGHAWLLRAVEEKEDDDDDEDDGAKEVIIDAE